MNDLKLMFWIVVMFPALGVLVQSQGPPGIGLEMISSELGILLH